MSKNAKRYPAWLRIKTTRAKKAGFTLVELMLVVLVLAVLVGLILPRFAGVQAKAEASTNASGIGEVQKVVELSKVMDSTVGSRWDSLINVTASLYDGLSPTAAASLTETVLTAPQAQCFIDAGFTDLAGMTTGAADKTADANSGVLGALGVGAVVAVVDNAVLLSEMGITLPVGHTAFAVGMGNVSTLRGTRYVDAPYSNIGKKPSDVYSRYMLIFSYKNNPTAGDKIRFLGALDADLKGLQKSLNRFNAVVQE